MAGTPPSELATPDHALIYARLSDADLTLTRAVGGAERLTGYDAATLRDRPGWLRYVAPEDRATVRNLLDTTPLGETYRLEYRIRQRTGTLRWVWDYGVVTPGEQGTVHEGTVVDAEGARRTEARLAHYESLLENVSDIITIVDPDGTIQYESPSIRYVLGFTPEELVGRQVLELVHPDDRETVQEALRAAANRPDHAQTRLFRFMGKDGRWRYLRAIGLLPSQDPFVHGIVGTVRDVTDEVAAEQALRRSEERYRHMALYDPVTRLPNRRLHQDRLAQALRSADRSGKHVAVLFLDLDHFKSVNDRYGHSVGDAALSAIADRLVAQIRESDTLARVGGDEFVGVLADLDEWADLRPIVDRLLATSAAPLTIEGHQIQLTASIGAVVRTSREQTPEQLLAAADHAMYQAKRQGDARYRILSAEDAVEDGGVGNEASGE